LQRDVGGRIEPMSSANSAVGIAVKRIENKRFLTGQGCFVANLTVPGRLYGAVRRSKFTHARLVSIVASAARALPGVIAAIAAADIGPAVPHTRLRHHGAPVAMVVSDRDLPLSPPPLWRLIAASSSGGQAPTCS
jgi:CO/xanthine dehydrogenase Mo-binding subunit